MLELDRKEHSGCHHAVLPGTTARTKGNAGKLEAHGVTLKTVDIKAAVDQRSWTSASPRTIFPLPENGQARMRTLVLMNLANKNGGMVVGTGDLSGAGRSAGRPTTATTMSMNGVNGSIPKTLVRYLVLRGRPHPR